MRSRIAMAFVAGVLVGGGIAFVLVAANRTQESRVHEATPTGDDASQEEPLHTDWVSEFKIGKNGRMPVIAIKVFDEDIHMLIDTGAHLTSFDNRIKGKLGEAIGPGKMTSDEVETDIDLFEAPEFDFGGYKFKSEKPVFCVDFGKFERDSGQKFDGVLAMDVLRHFVVDFDFDRGIVRLSKTPPSIPSGWSQLPLEDTSDGHVSLAAICGNLRRRFVIHTGLEHGITVEDQTYKDLVAFGEIEEGEFQAEPSPTGVTLVPSGSLKSFSLGPLVQHGLECVDADGGAMGIHYLSRFRIILDFPKGNAYFREGEKYAKNRSRGRAGIAFSRTSQGFTVHVITPGGPAELAGLKEGDEIFEINGEAASKLDKFEFRELLSAEPGKRTDVCFLRNKQKLRGVIVTEDRLAAKPQKSAK